MERSAERVSPKAGRPLGRRFYARHPVIVARAVLGRLLVFDGPRGRISGLIVESEAYRGAEDPASHAYRGITPRSRVMFGRPGCAYVYFVYGVHHCLNLVTEPKGRPSAVLVRALEPVDGIEWMREQRGAVKDWRLARGPGSVARALGITLAQDGVDLVSGPLWLSDLPPRRAGSRIVSGPRVGIRRGLDLPWRFYLEGHPCVSSSGLRAGSRRGQPPIQPIQIPVDTPETRS